MKYNWLFEIYNARYEAFLKATLRLHGGNSVPPCNDGGEMGVIDIIYACYEYKIKLEGKFWSCVSKNVSRETCASSNASLIKREWNFSNHFFNLWRELALSGTKRKFASSANFVPT